MSKIRTIQDLMPETYKSWQSISRTLTREAIIDFIKAQKYDFNLRDSIILLSAWVNLPQLEKWNITKADRDVIRELITNLKFCLEDAIDIQPYISEEFAQKMNDMTQQEYEEYLQEFTDKYLEEGGNYELKYPRIGELSRCLTELKIDDRDLWNLIIKYFQKNRYRPNLHDSLSALEGLRFYKEILALSKQPRHSTTSKTPAKLSSANTTQTSQTQDQQPLILPANTPELVEIIKKMEYNIEHTLWYDNMKMLERVINALYRLDRTENKAIYDKVEYYILSNWGEEYTADMMIDIAYKYMLAGYGSKGFFQDLQTVIARGHMTRFGGFMAFFRQQEPFTLSVNNVKKIFELYSYAHVKYPNDIVLLPDFKVHMFNSVAQLSKNDKAYIDLQMLENLSVSAPVILELDKREIADFRYNLAEKSINTLNTIQYISDVNTYIRNNVLPHFPPAQQKAFISKLTDSLKNNLIKINDPAELITLGNILTDPKLVSHDTILAYCDFTTKYLSTTSSTSKNHLSKDSYYKINDMLALIVGDCCKTGVISQVERDGVLKSIGMKNIAKGIGGKK